MVLDLYARKRYNYMYRLKTYTVAKTPGFSKIQKTKRYLFLNIPRYITEFIFQLHMSENSVTGNVWSAASRKIREFSPQCTVPAIVILFYV